MQNYIGKKNIRLCRIENRKDILNELILVAGDSAHEI